MLGSVKGHLFHCGREMWTQREWRTGLGMLSPFPSIPVKEKAGSSVGSERFAGALRVCEGVKYKSTRGLLGRGSSFKFGERDFVVEPSRQINQMPLAKSVGCSQRHSLESQEKSSGSILLLVPNLKYVETIIMYYNFPENCLIFLRQFINNNKNLKEKFHGLVTAIMLHFTVCFTF